MRVESPRSAGCAGRPTRHVPVRAGRAGIGHPRRRPAGRRCGGRRTPTVPTPAYAAQASAQTPSQDLARPAQAALLPSPGRPPGQGHPRATGP
jgi:hypothetical protein